MIRGRRDLLLICLSAFVSFMLASLTNASAQSTKSKSSADAAAQQAIELQRANSLYFFLAKGPPDSCGAGCSEWIAAEGIFDSGLAADRLRDFLKRMPAGNRPIFFNSRGGSGNEAIKIGRLLRERKIVAGVGVTVPADCQKRALSELECKSIKRSGGEVAADLDMFDGHCDSSCVWALVGGVRREVSPGARVGVHAAIYTRTYKDGKVTAGTAAELAAANKRTKDFLIEMGIDPGLVDFANTTNSNTIHYLNGNELKQFKIVPRPSRNGD